MKKEIDSKIILGQVLQKFIDKRQSKFNHFQGFVYVSHTAVHVEVLRENGKAAKVPFKSLLTAIEAYQHNEDFYNDGPTRLREFGLKFITSPAHSLLHLLPKDQYIVK